MFSDKELAHHFYAENCKMLMKERKDLNRWRDTQCPHIRRFVVNT